jgi:hypothetical protein
MAALTLVAACADGDWQRPGFSDAENQQAYTACQAQADGANARAYTAERTQWWDGGMRAFDEPLGGLPRRYGRGDLNASDDAFRNLDRERLRSEAIAARDRAMDQCLRAAGFAWTTRDRP